MYLNFMHPKANRVFAMYPTAKNDNLEIKEILQKRHNKEI